MSTNLYNNVGIPAIGMAATLFHCSRQTLSLTKSLLILPMVTNRELLSYLAHGKVTARGLEKLIIEKPAPFVNFNDRFYDSLSTSINGLQLLYDIEAIKYANGNVTLTEPIKYDSAMGKRAAKIYAASENIAILLQDHAETLYLNLRVKI